MNKKNNRFVSRIKKECSLFAVLMKSMPIYVIVIFSFSVIAMNLLSNIVVVNLPYLALNAGIFVSWIAFILMDVTTKYFGAKAGNWVSIIAITANSVFVLICLLISYIGTIPELDMLLHGQWSIWLASTIAFIVSAVANNYMNVFITKMFKNKEDSKIAFATSFYVSTFLGQCLDNFVFVFLAFVIFPMIPGAIQIHYTIVQCIVGSVLVAIFELLFEVVFSPIGYLIIKRWKEKQLGEEYLNLYLSYKTN